MQTGIMRQTLVPTGSGNVPVSDLQEGRDIIFCGGSGENMYSRLVHVHCTYHEGIYELIMDTGTLRVAAEQYVQTDTGFCEAQFLMEGACTFLDWRGIPHKGSCVYIPAAAPFYTLITAANVFVVCNFILRT